MANSSIWKLATYMAAMTVLTSFTALGEETSAAEVIRVKCFTSEITALSADYDSSAIKFHVTGKDFVYVIPKG